MPSAPRSRQTIVLGLLLFLAVLGVFLPAIRNGFVNYDDPEYVTANFQIHRGLTWDGVRWAFDGVHAANWHPLTWLSHMADCQLYGLSPWGHHLSSVLLHACNALLLFLVLRRMTGATWRSLAVAALFGLHPLHVESVAWVSERKDVLSALFWMLTLGAYAAWAPPKGGRRKAEGGNGIYYVLALLFLALGLMSKAMLVSVPFVLLLLDYWPLGRLGPSAESTRWRTLAGLVGEKIPFFAVVAVACAVTLAAQKHAGAVSDLALLPLGSRIENALISYCRYLGELAYPVNLSVYYPYPDAWPVAQVFLAGAFLIGVTAAAVRLRRKHPYMLVGWLWYLGTLVPVIGLVQVGSQSMADRYTYIPSIGVFMFLAWGLDDLTTGWRGRAAISGVAAAAVLGSCVLLTSRQIGNWADSQTLFTHALAVTENNWLAHNNLGEALLQSGKAPAAIAECREALRLNPSSARAHSNLADGLMKIGRSAEAIDQYQQALQLAPTDADIHNNWGIALSDIGRWPEAMDHFREALKLRPEDMNAHYNLGNLLAESGRTAEAVEQFAAASRLQPDNAGIRNNLGCALAELGRTAEARFQFEEALRLKPDYAEARANLERLIAP